MPPSHTNNATIYRDTSNVTSYRDTWTFQVMVKDLREAVAAKITWHTGRRDFWSEQYQKADAELRESGVQIRKDVGGVMNYTSRESSRVVIDPDMLQRVQVCQDKIREHEDQLRTFQSYARALRFKGADAELPLTIGDMLFLGMGQDFSDPAPAVAPSGPGGPAFTAALAEIADEERM